MAAVRPFSLLCFLFLFLFLFLCLPFPALSLTDKEALLSLKTSFSNPNSFPSWLPDQDPCISRWVGVFCSKNSVIGLNIANLGLTGKIDVDALLQLRSLRSLSFVNNNFSGPIPEFNRITTLRAIYLTNNQFSGSIPPDFFTPLGSLKKLWINKNKFSGLIPDSLTKLNSLAELHIDDNEFSGPIPEFKQEIKSLAMANNYLQGPIPASMSNHPASSFSGNEGLCGKPLDKPCDGAPSPPLLSNGGEKGLSWVARVILVLIIVAVFGMIMIVVKKMQSRNDNFSVISTSDQQSIDDEVQVHVQSTSRSHGSEGVVNHRKGGGSGESKRGSGRSGGMGDLIMVNDEKGVFGLTDLMKAAAEVLGNGGLGSAYKAAMANGLSVVVKRMREMNKVSRDIFDAEMRRFGRLRNRNILTPLAYHYRKEEKLFVTEYMPKGSLLYVLHGDRGLSHSELTWSTRLKIVKGIAKGLDFLYNEFSAEDLPHGNLKSSNVLLTDEYEPLLSDFAFHPLMNQAHAIQTMFAYKAPDFVQYQQISRKTDVYCLGIIILEIITGKFPSQYHNNGKGGTDVVQWVFTAICDRREAELIDPELKNNANSIDHMLQLLQIGAACTESNPEQRLTMKEAIRRIEEIQV